MSNNELHHDLLPLLYGTDKTELEKQKNRYAKLIESFEFYFHQSNPVLFSTPGRTEIAGNHTDHNNGIVLAASINLDSLAAAERNNTDKIKIISEGYSDPFEIDANKLNIVSEEKGTTTSLIRGIAKRFDELGFNIGGFNASISSSVMPGSGLSSSASIEVLIGTILNTLFNDGKLTPEEIAIIGQWSENNYFGKPCGLMDQLACAVGGIIMIDFKENAEPVFEKISFDFNEQGYKLLVVDTGGSHADLTDDYAEISKEMKKVASFFGKRVCREIDPKEFYENITSLRDFAGDRAVLRTIHFFDENERVLNLRDAVRQNDIDTFLNLIKSSGDSSFKWLQNIYSPKHVGEQGVSLAQVFTDRFIRRVGAGAYRIHGGGFAGTILVFLKSTNVEHYTDYMKTNLGINDVMVLNIREKGTVCLNQLANL